MREIDRKYNLDKIFERPYICHCKSPKQSPPGHAVSLGGTSFPCERRDSPASRALVGGRATRGNFTGLVRVPFNNHITSCRTMEKKGLTATSFLKSAEMRDKYECGICYEVCMKPVRCKGRCAKIFCMKCVSDTRQEVDRCPYKCSEPFLVERLPEIQLDFFCPYNPSECHAHIDSLRAFEHHHRFCPFVSQEELHRKQMQAQYKCLSAHQLEFFVGSYEEMMESTCAACKEKRLCRSYCRICSQFYCVGCRVPPCAKEGCPIGHAFAFQQIANLNFICDICGVSTAVSNDGVYDDSLCNFGICEDCYSELPAEFDQSKPRELIANINTLCSCGKALEFVDAVHHPSICALCTRSKECPKSCPNCLKRYCLSCKLLDVNFDNTCGHEHEIQACGPAGAQEQAFGCMRCGAAEEEYLYDKECNVRLCSACVDYCRMVTSDKQRPITLKCQKNHVLVYVSGAEDWYDNCVVCKQQKSIKLRCMYCSEEGESYCFQCRPISLETCYYKHPLKLGHFQSERECHYCRRETDELYFCKKCYFYVCVHCHAQHQPRMEEEESEAHPHKIEEEGEAHPHKIEKKESGSTEEKMEWSSEEKMEDCKLEEFSPDKLEEEL